jgi:hypothetical protein
MASNYTAWKTYLPTLVLFLGCTLIFFTAQTWLQQWNIVPTVILVGNGLIALTTVLSLYLSQKALQHKTTSGFLRNTYAGFMIKFFVTAVAVIGYATTAGKSINANGIFVCVALYIAYLFIEKKSLLYWNKQQQNA